MTMPQHVSDEDIYRLMVDIEKCLAHPAGASNARSRGRS
jgi:hypothetical protein